MLANLFLVVGGGRTLTGWKKGNAPKKEKGAGLNFSERKPCEWCTRFDASRGRGSIPDPMSPELEDHFSFLAKRLWLDFLVVRFGRSLPPLTGGLFFRWKGVFTFSGKRGFYMIRLKMSEQGVISLRRQEWIVSSFFYIICRPYFFLFSLINDGKCAVVLYRSLWRVRWFFFLPAMSSFSRSCDFPVV